MEYKYYDFLQDLKLEIFKELQKLHDELESVNLCSDIKKDRVNKVIISENFFGTMDFVNHILYDDYINTEIVPSRQNNSSNLEKIIKSLNSILNNFENIKIEIDKKYLNLGIMNLRNHYTLINNIRTNSVGGKPPVKKSPVKKSPVKKSPVKKSPVKKSLVKKSPVKKSPVKKSPVKKSPVKKSPVKK